ncbi:ABC transporter permease [Devosia sp. RR2S18]|jgi:ABC-2 type transport system permease protein|uniref:ABC transporter permease n=1 Tax=Devosia rhizosphaerae TaxID=3049774 RepID=UPI002541763E|nr:ABC-2 family transporter protein [Devosia sp. RR2S18]WIJ23470.1 ABC-2 family transporter protein [Devosia sp. RR2S18]HEV7290895.1 ABC-2 family transporter protein [Devosia sp.]
MLQTLPVLWHLARLKARTNLEYRSGLVIAWVAQAFGYAGVYAAIWIITSRFERLGGWVWPEIALMLGFHVFAYALGACFTLVQLRGMDELVRRGGFDALLVRPIHPWLYLVFSGFNIEYGGHFALGLLLMFWAMPLLDVTWSLPLVLQFVGSIISAALLTGALLTMLGASAMVLGRSRYLFGIYFDFWEIARYPLTIFAPALQLVLLTVVPLAFMAYVPVAVILDKPVPLLGGWAWLATLLAGPVVALLAAFYWRACEGRYQSGGG